MLFYQLLTIFGLLLPLATSYRFLFMGPFPAPSHWMWLDHFLKELLNRGHHVTAVTNHKSKQPHPNYTEILIDPVFDIPARFPKANIFEMRYLSNFQNLQMWWDVGVMTSEYALNDPKVKKLIASKDLHFDCFILEQFFHESFLLFGHKFNAPVVTIGTMGYADNMDHAMGLLTPWSSIPHLVLPHSDDMTFSQRAYNTFLSLYDNFFRRWHYLPQMQQMAEKHFAGHIDGPVPSVRDLEKNISLMLINSHRSVDVPRPTIGGLVNVGGVHVKPPRPLPQDIQTFLDNSKNGVVYFSLGSYVKSSDMPREKIKIILEAFGKLTQNVLWKYEDKSLTDLPPNVMIKKWMPQNDILAHSNVKLFITHGGIFGTQEGIHWGKPMLCLPLYGDQHRNTLKSMQAGYALSANFAHLSVGELTSKIQTLLTDPTYTQKAREVSELFRDNPMHPMDEAMFWIEYVCRHRGARHLKSHAVNLSLFQYLLLDVFLAALAVLLVPLYLIWRILRRLRRAKAVVKECNNNDIYQKKFN